MGKVGFRAHPPKGPNDRATIAKTAGWERSTVHERVREWFLGSAQTPEGLDPPGWEEEEEEEDLLSNMTR